MSTFIGHSLANQAAAPSGPSLAAGVSANKRFMVDQFGSPWFMSGDSAWDLVTNISPSDQLTYINNRASFNGFNCILFAALCDTYILNTNGDAMTTFDGVAPFTVGSGTSMDITTPNPTYWTRVDNIVNACLSRGLTCMIVPCESGVGGAAGQLVVNNGTTKAFQYGQFLASRYNSHKGIIWCHGNDYGGDALGTPTGEWGPDDPALLQVVAGIRSTTPSQLQTVELCFEKSTSDLNSNWPPVIDLRTVYSYYASYDEAQFAYVQTPTQPTFYIEGNYENSTLAGTQSSIFTTATPAQQLLMLRRQNYWPSLCGCAGGLYGNQIVFPFTGAWATNLVTTATTQFGYWNNLFRNSYGGRWQNFVPDLANTFMTGGFGTANTNPLTSNFAVAAKTSLGDAALVYCPDSTTNPVIDLTQMQHSSSIAAWFDPTTGTNGGTLGPFSGTHTYTNPGLHADGTGDWILQIVS